MTKPENRWQLLLVADDGRIVPFKRIKGIAVSLGILLVLLALVCAGLGWWLTVNHAKHRQTVDQLKDARRRATQYKSELELTTAELVLAEARMEKAGLPIPRRQERTEQQQPPKTVVTPAASDTTTETSIDETAPPTSPTATAANQPAISPTAAMTKQAAPEKKPAEAKSTPAKVIATPTVELGKLKLKHDTAKKVLLARFRVNNAGPRSTRVAGRCVVVLKNERMDHKKWLAMPDVALVNGKPDGERGQAFRISRFIDMKIRAVAPADPSSYDKATVYVFDDAGSIILEKDFTIDLPAPKPVSTPAVQPAADGMMSDTQSVPASSLPTKEKTPLKGAGETTGYRPTAAPADDVSGQGPQPDPDATESPADDPSLIDSAVPGKNKDARSRF